MIQQDSNNIDDPTFTERTPDFRKISSEPWLLRLRLLERPGLRWCKNSETFQNCKYISINKTLASLQSCKTRILLDGILNKMSCRWSRPKENRRPPVLWEQLQRRWSKHRQHSSSGSFRSVWAWRFFSLGSTVLLKHTIIHWSSYKGW